MAAPGLLALSSEVLRMLWDRLGAQSGLGLQEGDEQTQRSRVQHRHALRCTCKQLRDAVTPFITTLGVAFRRGDEGDDSPPWEETLQGALRQLAAFPAAATLRSLRWCYIEQGSGGTERFHSVSLPLLLPSFLLDARARLGSVERATLLGQLELGYGEISGLVDACPQLQALTIGGGPVTRHALAPLARLLGLRALSLKNVEPPPGNTGGSGSGVYDCLAFLSSLTRLEASDAIRPDDLLPHLRGLPSLLDLSLSLRHPGPARELDLHHLSHLTQLTSLSLTSGCPLSPNLGLCLPSTLVHLHLPLTTLDSDAIQAIMALPRLSELLAEELAPERDHSAAVGSFARLSFLHSSTPLHFTRLPLRNVSRLCMGTYMSAGAGRELRSEVEWCIDATSGLSDAVATLRHACQVLTRAMLLNGIDDDENARLHLTLHWTPAPLASSVQILEALSPLAELCRRQDAFRLLLGRSFDVSSEHVDRLASVLPKLNSLQVTPASLTLLPHTTSTRRLHRVTFNMAASPLVQLPDEVLRIVWDCLDPTCTWLEPQDTEATQKWKSEHQHALRCTCKQLRDATTPLITCLMVTFNSDLTEPPPAWEDTLQGALRQLAAFPAAAVLRSLHWKYVEQDVDGEHDAFDPPVGHHASLPQLLPSFLTGTRSRLANVERVMLYGQLVLGYGEISALVDACPQLQALTIDYGPIMRHALDPLARLAGLRALSIERPQPPAVVGAPVGGVYDAIARLSSLTVLRATDVSPDDFLPLLPGLRLLQDLSLSFEHDAEFLDLHYLSHLTQLTSLAIADGRLVGLKLVNLPLPATLVHLRLPSSVLDSAAIRLVAALPRLAQLTASQLHADCDLSGLACSYTQLCVTSCSSVQMTRLPLHSVTRLYVGYSRKPERHSSLNWALSASPDLPSATAALHQACQMLARVMSCNMQDANFKLTLHLGAGTSYTPAAAAPLVAALSPLSGLCRQPGSFELALGDDCDIGGEHVVCLASALPDLRTLQVFDRDCSTRGFASFAIAAASGLPQLRHLRVTDGYHSGALPAEAQAALLGMATLRARAGPPLTISVGRCMGEEQVQSCNATLALIRRTVGETPHNRVAFVV